MHIKRDYGGGSGDLKPFPLLRGGGAEVWKIFNLSDVHRGSLRHGSMPQEGRKQVAAPINTGKEKHNSGTDGGGDG